MQVTKGTWHMREQCVPGSLSPPPPAQKPGNEAKKEPALAQYTGNYMCYVGLFRSTISGSKKVILDNTNRITSKTRVVRAHVQLNIMNKLYPETLNHHACCKCSILHLRLDECQLKYNNFWIYEYKTYTKKKHTL